MSYCHLHFLPGEKDKHIGEIIFIENSTKSFLLLSKPIGKTLKASLRAALVFSSSLRTKSSGEFSIRKQEFFQ